MRMDAIYRARLNTCAVFDARIYDYVSHKSVLVVLRSLVRAWKSGRPFTILLVPLQALQKLFTRGITVVGIWVVNGPLSRRHELAICPIQSPVFIKWNGAMPSENG